MLEVIWLIPAFPLAGFLLILLFGRRLGEPFAGVLAATMVLASFVVSVGAYVDMLSMDDEERSHVETLFSWMSVGVVADRHGVPRRPAVDHDVPVRDRRGVPDPRVLDRVHARRPEVLQVLPLPQPVRAGDDAAGAGREPARHVPRVGGRRHVLVLPDLVLAHARIGGDRRQEGVRHQPHRRLRLHAGDVPRLRGDRLDQLRAAQPRRRGRRAGRVDRDRDRPAAVRRRGRQVGAAAALPVASRRDGRPDAGVGADPCRHDGHRRRVPDDAHQPDAGGGSARGRRR